MMNCQWVCLFYIPLFFQSLLSSNTKKPNRKYLLRFAVVPRVCFPSIGFASAKPIWSRRRWWMVDPFVNLKPKTCNSARDFIGWISLGGRAPEFVLFGLSLWLIHLSAWAMDFHKVCKCQASLSTGDENCQFLTTLDCGVHGMVG